LGSTSGYVVGNGGIILKTVDKGENWTIKNSGESSNLRSVLFLDANIGFAVGHSILKTLDAGENWTKISNAYSLQNLHFVNSTTGFIGGAGGQLYKTVDEGENWHSLNSGTQKTITSIYFTSPDEGYAVGGYGGLGIILKTLDGGETWATMVENSIKLLYSVTFTNSTTGYAAGLEGKIYRTNDGGYLWYEVFDCEQNISSLHFINQHVGMAVGWRTFITYDGGDTWSTDDSFDNIDSLGYRFKMLESVFMTSGAEAFSVGWKGTVLYRGDIMNTDNHEEMTESVTNYPNPFHSFTKFRYSVRESGSVTINIYDAFGKKVEVISAGYKNKANHEVEFNGTDVCSGIYFYTIVCSGNIEGNGKMIRID